MSPQSSWIRVTECGALVAMLKLENHWARDTKTQSLLNHFPSVWKLQRLQVAGDRETEKMKYFCHSVQASIIKEAKTKQHSPPPPKKKKQKNSGFSRETTCLKRCHYRWERWEFHDQFWQLHTHQSNCGKFSNLEWGTRKSYVNWQNVMFFKLSLKKQDYSFNEENKQIDKDHVFNSC